MTTTPQALGALIKRTGILKSSNRKGNSYHYHTEGYELTRQYGNRYTFNYYSRLSLARPSEAQQEAYVQRMRHAFTVVGELLTAKGIEHHTDNGVIWINLENKESN